MAGGKPPGIQGSTPAVSQDGTMCRTSSPLPGPLEDSSCLQSLDELTPIARYMAREMNVNSRSQDAQVMRDLNGFSMTECIERHDNNLLQRLLGPKLCADQGLNSGIAALAAWTLKVRQGADWDHKPIIAQRFNPRNQTGQQHWHAYANEVFFYDVWSNLHYGYVGAACGFTEAQLLDGAGLEQVGSTLLRGDMPEHTGNHPGARGYDDPADRAAVTQGIRLYSPDSTITAEQLVRLIVSNPSITRKPFQQKC